MVHTKLVCFLGILTLASALKPVINFTWAMPWRPKKGTIARITKAKIQFAENAIARAATIVDKFCTARDKVSPTTVFTCAASADSRALTAPLGIKNKSRCQISE